MRRYIFFFSIYQPSVHGLLGSQINYPHYSFISRIFKHNQFLWYPPLQLLYVASSCISDMLCICPSFAINSSLNNATCQWSIILISVVICIIVIEVISSIDIIIHIIAWSWARTETTAILLNLLLRSIISQTSIDWIRASYRSGIVISEVITI